MSRLDSFIRRLQAQRACLDHVAGLVAGVPGPVLELGLGNGRTYDHLRGLFPDREIFVFEREMAAHPACIPDDAHLLLGDIDETLPGAQARIGAPAVFAHCDIGTGDPDYNRTVAGIVRHALPPLMAPVSYIAADQPIDPDGFEPAGLPEGVPAGRYYLYRRAPGR